MDADQVPGGLPSVHPDLRDVKINDDLLHPKIKKYQGRLLPRWLVGEHLLAKLISLELVECPRLKQLRILSQTTLKNLVLSACSSLPIVSKEDLAIIRSTPQDVRISQVVTFMEGLVATYGPCIVSKIDWDLQHGYNSQELRNWLKKAMDIAYQNPQEEGEVVQLVLPPSLERLVIRSCPLTHSSLGQVLQSLTSLKYLELCNIVSLTSLPSADVLKCLTMLKSLHIKQCWFLTSLGGLQALGSLETLVISYCPSLSAEGGSTSILLPSSLEDLKIEACDWKHWDGSPPDPNSSIDSESSGRASLESLSITNCPNIDSLFGLQELNHLKQLTLMGCPKLAHAETKLRSPLLSFFVIDAPSLLMLLAGEALASLQHLWIEYSKEESFRWEELEQVFQHLTSLEALLFAHCSIKSLPNDLRGLSSLRELSIVDCPNITLLPHLPKTLSDLDLRGCNPELEKQGEYWRKILRSPYWSSRQAS